MWISYSLVTRCHLYSNQTIWNQNSSHCEHQEGTFHQVRQAKRSADLFMRELSSRLEVRQRRRRFFPMDYLFWMPASSQRSRPPNGVGYLVVVLLGFWLLVFHLAWKDQLPLFFLLVGDGMFSNMIFLKKKLLKFFLRIVICTYNS